MSRSHVPWLRLGAEALAILVSILLAFGIDAWWDARLESHRAREILADLHVEFLRNRETLRAMEAGHVSRSQAAVRLLNVATGAELIPPADSMDQLIFRAFSFDAGSFDPVQGVYEAISSSGELGLIRNDSLRYALASWPGQLQDAVEDEQWIIRDVQGMIQPYLFGVLPVGAAYQAGLAQLDSTLAISLGSASVDYGPVLQDTRFQNLLVAQAYSERFAARELGRLDTVISDVLRFIEASRQ